ncbi:hypothetical protein EXM63_17885 [Clostridium botulinum]|uniref:Uncharacterized protein n=1 Tax=Clostridium botulinum TaxID=1491 RepID=A0A6M0SWM9_CLOBO|nr:hypothetical protein [Clostridium botulinum]NFI74031.1 hypothetical protein [Clostridium sporogenes]EJP6474200.1 hypothetical protein [Clostridium botulinum]NFA59896.1 hypothetical protein [Clostridium botulinum]NFM24601.1 hypothetical protein [Clostridium sporogenes]
MIFIDFLFSFGILIFLIIPINEKTIINKEIIINNTYELLDEIGKLIPKIHPIIIGPNKNIDKIG